MDVHEFSEVCGQRRAVGPTPVLRFWLGWTGRQPGSCYGAQAGINVGWSHSLLWEPEPTSVSRLDTLPADKAEMPCFSVNGNVFLKIQTNTALSAESLRTNIYLANCLLPVWSVGGFASETQSINSVDDLFQTF